MERFHSNVMSKYKVAVMLNTSQVFVVEADDRAEAIEKISDEWDKGNLELCDPEISEADFSIVGEILDDVPL